MEVQPLVPNSLLLLVILAIYGGKKGLIPFYFGQDLPSFATKVKRWGISHVVKNNRGFSDLFTVSVYRCQRPRGKFPIDRYETYLIGILAIMGLIMFALSALVKIYLSALDYMTIQSINKRC